MFEFLNETYIDMAEKIMQCSDLKPFFIGYDKVLKDYFYISKVYADTVVINNNRWEDFMCVWDYEKDCLDENAINWINRFINKDNIIKIDELKDKESCINLVKSLQKLKCGT